MQSENIIKLAVGSAIGVLVFASLLIPVVSDSTIATLTITNEGTPYALYDGETHTIMVSLNDSDEVVITTDGEVCENPIGYNNTATIVYAQDGYVRLAFNTGNVRVFVSDSANALSPTVAEPITITVSSNAITMSKGATTYTADCTPCAYIAKTGSYVLTTSPYSTDSDVIYLGGTTNYSGGNYIGFVGYGTINDLTVSNTYSQPTADSTVSIDTVTAAVNSTSIVEDVVKINNVVFTALLTDESTLTGTFSYFLAPETITYNNPAYVGGNTADVLAILPLIVIMSLILGIVTYAVRARLS